MNKKKKKKKKKNIILIKEDKIEQMETDEQEEKYSRKEIIIYILKGISSILASIIHTFGYSSIWSLGYTTIYLISFRRHYNENLDFSYSYCFIPLMNLVFNLTAPLGGYFEGKYGPKKSIIFSNLFLCIPFFIMYFSRSIYLDYLLMMLNGFGSAIGFNITKKNACSFFMNKKALICSIIYLFPNFFCVILILYNEVFILNYDKYPSIEKIYYDENTFINYQKLIFFEIGLLIFTCLITYILYFQNDPKETAKFGFNEKVKKENDENLRNNEVEKVEKSKKRITKISLNKKILYNRRTINLIAMVFFFFPFINLINNILRMDIHFYFIFGALYHIVGCISCILFGLIGDFIQFKYLFIVLSIISSLASFCYIKYFDGEFILFLELILVSFAYNGFNVIFDAHIMNIYGMENFIEAWGITRASAGISQILGIILNFALVSNSPKYKIVYGIMEVFSIIALGFGLYEKEDKFDYNN